MEMMSKLEELLKTVEKPGRYLGGEWNAIRKDPHKVRTKVALVFPDLYEVGMSYLGQKILYYVLNEHPSILAERVFAPWIDFEQKLRLMKIPLYSLENKIPLNQFDILGFSLLYELNYSNILTILDLAHIPFFTSERNLEYPLIIAGGPAVFNPEPIADIFDFFLVGDGEEAFVEIIEKYRTLREELKDKNAILKEMAKIKGIYVPSFYTPYKPQKSSLLAVRPNQDVPEKIEKRVLFPFDRTPFPEKIVVPNIKVIFDRVAIDVARGCPQKCRFCQALSIYFPPRVKSPAFVYEKVLNSLKLTGYGDVSLTSLSISDYPYLDETVEVLMDELTRQKVSLSLSSLRPRGLSSDIAKNITKVRKTGFTIVLEAGTERLRRSINKDLRDEEIYEACQNAFSQGWKLLKLYFMVGLPTEKNEDLKGIVDLVEKVVSIGKKILGFAPHINLSVSAFIPKPHTPFQWLKMEEERNLKEKFRFLRSCLRKYSSVKFKRDSLKNSILEAVFSRGDRRLTQVLRQSWEKGARFDSWNDLFDFRIWDEGFECEGIDYNLYLSLLDKKAALPWDHISTGIKKSHLLQELDKAFKQETTLSCIDNKCGPCQGCEFSSLMERKFEEEIRISPEVCSLLGKKAKDVLRYRVFYSKLQSARFLSHIELNSIIQRAFRRAGISVAHSKGFHPKMMISHPPALPLGMEGRAECFEFKSCYLYEEKEFVPHVNKFLPSGIRFSSLSKLETFTPSLNEEIEALIYSVDLKGLEIRKALATINEERNISSFDDFSAAKKLIDDFLASNQNEFIESINIDKKASKIFLCLKHSTQKGIRSQEIVEDIFNVKNPVFAMAREKILFRKAVKN